LLVCLLGWAFLAQVGSDDLRIVGHLLRWALGDFLAVVEDNDFVREPQEKVFQSCGSGILC
jgi:hypothetical protein